MRDPRVAALREDGLVILDHPQTRDLLRDEGLQIAEGHRRRPVAEHGPYAVDHLFRARADRADGLDLPFILSLARELNQILAVGAMDAPSAALHPFDDVRIQMNG